MDSRTCKKFNPELYAEDRTKYFRDYMRMYNSERVECDICKRTFNEIKIASSS